MKKILLAFAALATTLSPLAASAAQSEEEVARHMDWHMRYHSSHKDRRAAADPIVREAIVKSYAEHYSHHGNFVIKVGKDKTWDLGGSPTWKKHSKQKTDEILDTIVSNCNHGLDHEAWRSCALGQVAWHSWRDETQDGYDYMHHIDNSSLNEVILK